MNLYLDDEMLSMWTTIPSGQRSSIIQSAIREYAGKNINPKEELIMKLKQKMLRIDNEITALQQERKMISEELNRVQDDMKLVEIDKEDVFSTIEERAGTLLRAEANYRSFTGKSYYRIHNIIDGKIYIRNNRTGRTNSNFTKKTVDLAIDRLVAAGGQLPIGQFVPVKMHEYAVVHLHPQLVAKNGLICWVELDMELVSSVPDNIPDDLESSSPPSEWVSDNNWLAVTVDGYKAHMCVNCRAYASDKVAIEFIEEHPYLGNTFATKYWMWKDGGFLYWGHHHLDGGGGSTHTILTPIR